MPAYICCGLNMPACVIPWGIAAIAAGLKPADSLERQYTDAEQRSQAPQHCIHISTKISILLLVLIYVSIAALAAGL
jgi:hypothetical protein